MFKGQRKEIAALCVMLGLSPPRSRGSYPSAFGGSTHRRIVRDMIPETFLEYHVPTRSLYASPTRAYVWVKTTNTVEEFQLAIEWLREQARRTDIQVLY